MNIWYLAWGLVFAAVACATPQDQQHPNMEATIEASILHSVAHKAQTELDKSIPKPPSASTLRKEGIENENPDGSACRLAGGEIVQSEWSGKDTGPNYCNSCQCMNGRLTCTEMACMPMISPTVIPPP
jgi:hypothetical protein